MAITLEKKFRIYDFFHRSSVRVCMGVTLIGHLYLGYRGAKYYLFDRAEMKETELRRIKSKPDSEETIAA